MKKIVQILVIIALAMLCYEMVAQNAQPTNGQVISPNGIEMVYVEGQGNIKSFYIGKYELTHQAWQAVMGSARSKDAKDDRPLTKTSWLDFKVFIKRLNELSGRTYRLPTEAEWEFAAKGGTLSHGYTYSGSNNIDEVAWYQKNSKSKDFLTAELPGTKKPNELGIYDMTGNVWEICEDCYDNKCDSRTFRGGSAWNDAKINRIETRGGAKPDNMTRYDVGFRLVLEP